MKNYFEEVLEEEILKNISDEIIFKYDIEELSTFIVSKIKKELGDQ